MTEITVKDYLSKFPPEICSIISALRTAARKNMPGAKEIIYHDALGYSTSGSPYDRICYIAPQSKAYVNFGFFFGGGLSDPKQLLIGEGKRLRHVKIRSVEEAKNPALARLIAATWKQAPKSIASIHTAKKA
jgi:hypothetical protein